MFRGCKAKKSGGGVWALSSVMLLGRVEFHQCASEKESGGGIFVSEPPKTITPTINNTQGRPRKAKRPSSWSVKVTLGERPVEVRRPIRRTPFEPF